MEFVTAKARRHRGFSPLRLCGTNLSFASSPISRQVRNDHTFMTTKKQ